MDETQEPCAAPGSSRVLLAAQPQLADHGAINVRALRIVHTSGKPAERKSQVQRSKGRPPLEVTVWLTPLPIPGQEIHLLVRVEELDFSTSA